MHLLLQSNRLRQDLLPLQRNPNPKPGMKMEQSDEINAADEINASDEVRLLDDHLRIILAQLPLRSLRLCKSVCKRWLSLITDPTFTRSPKTDRPYGLLLQSDTASSEFAYVPLDDVKKRLITSSFPFYPTSSRYVDVWQSCNGLLVCVDKPDKIYVYNPTINQYKLLPLPHVWKPNRFVKGLPIAFDPKVSPHYKIVYAHEDLPGGRIVHIEVYSSETGNWRACAHTFFLYSFMNFRRGVLYWRGAIHWLSRTSVSHFSLQDVDFIHVDNHTSLYGITYTLHDKLFLSRDRLLIARMLVPPLQQITVYAMNSDYFSGWSVKYHVDFECAVANFPETEIEVLALVLGEREEDSFLVLEVTGIMLIQYNIMSKAFQQLCDLARFRIRESLFCSFLFTPSIVGV